MNDDDLQPKDSTIYLILIGIIAVLLTLAQCAVANEVCKFQNVTYFNFDNIKDDWRFNIQEWVYTSNHDKTGIFGVEGHPQFVGEQVIFKSKQARPAYVLTLNKHLFNCENKVKIANLYN